MIAWACSAARAGTGRGLFPLRYPERIGLIHVLGDNVVLQATTARPIKPTPINLD
jgi:hypothetical protein